MSKLIDFSNCVRFPINNYGGNDKKEKIIYNNENYLLKFRNPNKKKSDLFSSESNNIFSEYICCHIIESIGLSVQETHLGTYNGEYVVACKDFTSPGVSLANFVDLSNSFISDSKLKPHPELNAILKCYEERFNADSSHPYRQHFWDLFIVDSLLGNFDRHAGNWGFLINERTAKIEPSPIYDCGSCLYPSLAEHSLKDIILSDKEVEDRIFIFPSSSICLNGMKINYFNFISSLENTECTEALLRVYPKISMEKINQIINETPIISETRKDFYKRMLNERYEKILSFSYEKALGLNKTNHIENNNSFKNCNSLIENAEMRSKGQKKGTDITKRIKLDDFIK